MKTHSGILFADRPGIRLARTANHIACSFPGGSAPCRIPFSSVSGIILNDRVHCSPAVISHALRSGIGISFVSPQPVGFIVPDGKVRRQILWNQLCTSRSMKLRLRIARWIVGLKTDSQRKLLRSWASHHHSPLIKETLASLRKTSRNITSAVTLEQLRGFEGEAAKLYWRVFAELASGDFFLHRSKQPPLSPADSMLSFGYAVLAHQVASVAFCKGLDLSCSSLHQEQSGFPSLAWDLIEPLRAPCVDRIIIAGIHRGRFLPDDFIMAEDGAFSMKKECRKGFLQDLFKAFSDPSGLFRVPIEKVVDDYISLIAEVNDNAF